MSSVPAQSADGNADLHVGASFTELVVAYEDCRLTKRNTASALAIEMNLERNLVDLFDELAAGTYRPGPSICFVVTRPKPREIWAAGFRDRIVHHLLYNKLGPRFERSFIADSCACIAGRGTLYAAERLEAKARSVSANWSRPAWYLKCDVANFFVSIDKRILWRRLMDRIPESWWARLAHLVLFHDPREDVILQDSSGRLDLVPPHKRLANQPEYLGLPIGNLSSQFFANVYLDALDQRVKHVLRARHYIRYVDDFLLLHESPAWLEEARREIEGYLAEALALRLNSSKTIVQPIARGVDFVGQVVKPWRRSLRRRTYRDAMARVATAASDDLLQSANSYFGLLRQATASHGDRARLARLLRRRGIAVNRQFTKGYAWTPTK